MTYSVFHCKGEAPDDKMILRESENVEEAFEDRIKEGAGVTAHQGVCKEIAKGFKTWEEAEESEAYWDPPNEMPSDHEMLLHFGIEELGSPALVLDEATARATACSCFTYKGRDYCWSKGCIGLLKREQQKIYCVAGKTYKAQPKLVERYTTFAEAAEEAHKKIETMPKGRERLMTWLEAMGKELSKRAIEV